MSQVTTATTSASVKMGGYRPLRTLNVGTWNDESAARELKSAAEVQAGAARGNVTIERPGIIVQDPIIVGQDAANVYDFSDVFRDSAGQVGQLP